jgi:hypothetical protein
MSSGNKKVLRLECETATSCGRPASGWDDNVKIKVKWELKVLIVLKWLRLRHIDELLC